MCKGAAKQFDREGGFGPLNAAKDEMIACRKGSTPATNKMPVFLLMSLQPTKKGYAKTMTHPF